MFIAQPIANPVAVTYPDGNDIPLVLDSPHSGTLYPGDYNSHQPLSILRRSEDTYVDDLFKSAVDYGATFVEAMFPRTYIDPNRSLLDFNPDMIVDKWDEPVTLTDKSKTGKGLIWQTVKGDYAIYNRPITAQEVKHRINQYYKPYHHALNNEVDRLLKKFGVVYHIDCHSMVPLGTGKVSGENKGDKRAAFNMGNRDGTTCSAEFTHAMMDIVTKNATPEQQVNLNFPYKGVEIVKRYGKPEKNCHSIQIEINRGMVLDGETLQPNAYYDQTKQQMNTILRDVADYVRNQI